MSDQLRAKINEVLDKAKSVVFGQDDMLTSLMAALVCEGHLLIEGMPGLGKTLSVSTMSKLCDLDFNRIQFTPDLLPSDLIGTMIYNQSKDEFSTKFGPIFTQILLADEINRSPAKVQSALLEAMAEKQVTIGDSTHKLKRPFVVLATQNPVEQEGTYPLPEAQMDRFMMKVNVDYPDFKSEISILDHNSLDGVDLSPLITEANINEIRNMVNKVFVDDKIKEFIVRTVTATRPSSEYFLKKYDGAILAGGSPRAGIWLYKIAKFKAFLEGKDFVSPDNVVDIVPSVLGHRMILTYEASIDNISGRELAVDIAQSMI